MGYMRGEGRNQGTLFPVVLDDLVPADHVCRVIDAFVEGLAMSELCFERAEAAETGRPGYDPRDLLKLYLYGYLHTIRSSRRLEAECRRNVELMWLLGRLYPDHKSIAEFRRVHRDAVTAAGTELVRFARDCGLIRGEWIAVDGTKFRAVASADSVRERKALEKYLDSMERADEEQQATIDPSAVQAALEKLKQHPEPEAGFMRVAGTIAPAYNVYRRSMPPSVRTSLSQRLLMKSVGASSGSLRALLAFISRSKLMASSTGLAAGAACNLSTSRSSGV